MTDPKELSEAIEVLQGMFEELTTPQPIKVDSPHYKRRNSLSDALTILQALSHIPKQEADVSLHPKINKIFDYY